MKKEMFHSHAREPREIYINTHTQNGSQFEEEEVILPIRQKKKKKKKR